MKSIYIYTHLGLGDMIIANGLVRTVADDYDRVYVFCKPHNLNNISFMYRDDQRIKLIPMDDQGVRRFMDWNKGNEYLIVGHSEFNKIWYSPSNTLTIDEIFYKMAGVPIENKFSRFFIERDREREMECYSSYGLHPDQQYSFIHDKPERAIRVPGMRPNSNYMLWDHLTLIERSWETHVISSSFYCMIDVMGLPIRKGYLHMKREWGQEMPAKHQLEWIINR